MPVKLSVNIRPNGADDRDDQQPGPDGLGDQRPPPRRQPRGSCGWYPGLGRPDTHPVAAGVDRAAPSTPASWSSGPGTAQ
jgi:hypothetical protein